MPLPERTQKSSSEESKDNEVRSELDPQHTLELDLTIVLGEGPVKPVLIPTELTEAQIQEWSDFKRDPLRTKEPDFFVIEGKAYLDKLDEIGRNNGLSEVEKRMAQAKLRDSWQHTGRFAMKRMGKQNALASGIALLHGFTKEIIISGGHTIPKWRKDQYRSQMLFEHSEYRNQDEEEVERLLDQYLRFSIRWPSEAELIRDIIIHQFDTDYRKKFNNRPISDVIRIETNATNTLENIVLSINRNHDLLLPHKKVGVLSAEHHMRRGEVIGEKYGINIQEKLSAQQILVERAKEHHRHQYTQMLEFMRDVPENEWLQNLVKGELRFLRGLTDKEYLTYWLGYTFMLEDPRDIKHVVSQLIVNPDEEKALHEAFAKVDLDFDDFKEMDLEKLAKEDPAGYNALRYQLTRLTRPDLRAMPPEVTELPPLHVG